ncbi:DgyrCDS113 [Dimorphilus gyrociliatus]|uniref:DgyrCDS113 n=1 Tax=Dimorphilus gyrociliatus TaxID=2664684 RepID=A0A7I8V3W4_9ANNE|nr:DgyrCDS113 [Dimorphilus gyrociliatus]
MAYQYGQGQGYQQPQGYNNPPARPPPPNPNQPNLSQIFQAVDKDRSGFINAQELQSALSNGTHIPFNEETIKLMISMFDSSRSGQINFENFQRLWAYINQWQQTFRGFDRDNSGFVDQNELAQAFQQFGYRFSQDFIGLLMRKFNRHNGKMAFDDFIQCCVAVQSLTSTFASKDSQRKGQITVGFEEFLSMIFSVRT